MVGTSVLIDEEGDEWDLVDRDNGSRLVRKDRLQPSGPEAPAAPQADNGPGVIRLKDGRVLKWSFAMELETT